MLNNNCFFISAIGDSNSEQRRNSNEVIEQLVKPVMDSIGFKVVRADLINGPTQIFEDIKNHLNLDEIVIADISYNNPNVFFEIGYRYSNNLDKDKSKMPILIRRKDSNFYPPFDISGFRYLEYELKSSTIEYEKAKLLDYTGLNELPNNLRTLFDVKGNEIQVIVIPNKDPK